MTHEKWNEFQRATNEGFVPKTEPTKLTISGTRKDDKGKSPIFQGVLAYFPKALSAVADVSAFGASKYAWNGWRHVEDGLSRYTDALVRHLIATEELDPESQLLHAAHCAWNSLARLELLIQEREEIDGKHRQT